MSLRTHHERRDHRAQRVAHPPPSQIGMALVIAGFATVAASALQGHVHNANLAMVYLLGVVVSAVRYGPIAAVTNTVVGICAFDFFFVPPYFGFKPNDPEYYVTLPVMLIVALTLTRLASSLREQAALAEQRAQRVTELYRMSRELAAQRDCDALCTTAMRHLNDAFDGLSLILLPDAEGHLSYPKHFTGPKLHVPDEEMALAQWALDNGQPAGRESARSIGADARFQPLPGAGGIVGVLAIRFRNWERLKTPDGRRQLETFASQIALALERARLSEAAEQAHVHIEREQLRNSLLAAISHDLRTPLATILGAASHLSGDAPSDTRRRELAGAIVEETQHMTELITKVLDMARFEAGGLHPNVEWLVLDEITDTVLTRVQARATQHHLSVVLAPDLGLVQADPLLIQRVLLNLVENALKYTPAGSYIRIQAQRRPDDILLSVSDNGPGLPAGLEEAVFDKFFRVHPESPAPGVGLGLTICRAIVTAHGGTIWAESVTGGGAQFSFTLPQHGEPPALIDELDTIR